jgi:small-conductance mechanosensitive channel
MGTRHTRISRAWQSPGCRGDCDGTGWTLLVGLLLFAWLAAMPAAPTSAATGSGVSPTASDVDTAPEYLRAAVTLDGKVLFYVRGVASYPATRRAREFSENIRNIAADPSIAPDSLRAVEGAEHTNIVTGDRTVLTVLDSDAELEGISRKIMTEVARRKIAEAMTAYRIDRSPRVLLINTGYALGATLVLVLLLLAIRRLFRWLDTVAGQRFKSRIEGLEAQSFQLLQARQLVTVLHTFLKTLAVLSGLVIVYGYLNFVLGLYPWSRPLAQQLFALFLHPLYTIGTAVLSALPNLMFLAIVVMMMRYVLKVARFFFAGLDQGTITMANFDREWAWPTYRIIRVLIIAFTLVVAYPYIPGSSSEAFKGVSLFLGIIFSLGSSSVIASVIAGHSMTYRRAFKVGDRIQVNDLTGDVVEMRPLVTRLRTVKNEEIVVPNSLILNSHVINYSTLAQSRGLILHTTVGIGYETPWRQVEAMLRVAAERTPGVLKEPPLFVLQQSLGDFAVTYELNVYCDNPQAMARLYTALHQNILDVFNEYGIQIMTPAYEGDPEQPKVVPKGQWFMAPATNPAPTDGASGKSEMSR